jgi:hypothetical protein
MRKSLWFMVCLPASFSIPAQFGVPSWSFRRTFSVRLRPTSDRNADSSKLSVSSPDAALGAQGRCESAVDDEGWADAVPRALVYQRYDQVGYLFGACEPPCYRIVSLIDTSYMLNVLDW